MVPPLLNDAVLLSFCVVSVRTDGRLPRFDDYPSPKIYHGKIFAPKFKDLQRNKDLRDLAKRAELRKFPWKWQMDTVVHRKVDFAGHYILVSGSAGGNSALFNAVDAKTGYLYPFPYEMKVVGQWQYEHESDHRRNSRLIIMHGHLFDESAKQPDLPVGDHYFVFSHHHFSYIGSVIKSKDKVLRGVRVLKSLH